MRANAKLPDAVELPPHGDVYPKRSDVLVYPAGQKFVLDVCPAGQWRRGIVRERLRFGAGRTAYRVLLELGTGRHEIRTYIWGLH